jgi:hypothetical protein
MLLLLLLLLLQASNHTAVSRPLAAAAALGWRGVSWLDGLCAGAASSIAHLDAVRLRVHTQERQKNQRQRFDTLCRATRAGGRSPALQHTSMPYNCTHGQPTISCRATQRRACEEGAGGGISSTADPDAVRLHVMQLSRTTARNSPYIVFLTLCRTQECPGDPSGIKNNMHVRMRAITAPAGSPHWTRQTRRLGSSCRSH